MRSPRRACIARLGVRRTGGAAPLDFAVAFFAVAFFAVAFFAVAFFAVAFFAVAFFAVAFFGGTVRLPVVDVPSTVFHSTALRSSSSRRTRLGDHKSWTWAALSRRTTHGHPNRMSQVRFLLRPPM